MHLLKPAWIALSSISYVIYELYAKMYKLFLLLVAELFMKSLKSFDYDESKCPSFCWYELSCEFEVILNNENSSFKRALIFLQAYQPFMIGISKSIRTKSNKLYFFFSLEK